MKKVLLICTLFLSFSGVKAQGYESLFGSGSTEWNIADFLPDATFTVDYSLGNSISINGITYRSILRYGNSVSEFSIREDTLTGKAWVYNTISNSEDLVYDISLNVGDSLLTALPFWFSSGDYAIADSVYYINNRKHIRFNRFLSWYWNDIKPFEMIEGIGPNTGMFGYWDYIKLVCARKDGNLIYADSGMFNNGPCMYINLGINDNHQNRPLTLYPNPANSNLTFALANQSNLPVWLTITDAMGRTISREITTAENPRIAVENWANGVYFFRIWADGKPAASGKFFVAH